MNNLISIIIPTFNRANLVRETLDSIISQTHQNWECIIVDDGSEDNTIEIVRTYTANDKRFKFYERRGSELKGPNKCRNYGFNLSHGDYIKWFDSDDVMLPNLLQRQFLEIGNSDVNICEILKYDFEKEVGLGKNKIKSDRIIESYFTGEVSFYICGPLWRRNFLTRQDVLFDESIRNLDDWDFNLRMLYQNPTISYIDEPLIKYRIHENSLSKEISKLNFKEISSELRAREKHVAILKSQENNLGRLLNSFILQRLTYILRTAIIKKDVNWFQYLKLLIKKQVELNYFISIVRTVFILMVYKISGKGEKLLKQI